MKRYTLNLKIITDTLPVTYLKCHPHYISLVNENATPAQTQSIKDRSCGVWPWKRKNSIRICIQTEVAGDVTLGTNDYGGCWPRWVWQIWWFTAKQRPNFSIFFKWPVAEGDIWVSVELVCEDRHWEAASDQVLIASVSTHPKPVCSPLSHSTL